MLNKKYNHRSANQSGQTMIMFTLVFLFLIFPVFVGFINFSTIFTQENNAYSTAIAAANAGAKRISISSIYSQNTVIISNAAIAICQDTLNTMSLQNNSNDSGSSCTIINNGTTIEANYVDTFSIPIPIKPFNATKTLNIVAYSSPVAGS